MIYKPHYQPNSFPRCVICSLSNENLSAIFFDHRDSCYRRYSNLFKRGRSLWSIRQGNTNSWFMERQESCGCICSPFWVSSLWFNFSFLVLLMLPHASFEFLLFDTGVFCAERERTFLPRNRFLWIELKLMPFLLLVFLKKKIWRGCFYKLSLIGYRMWWAQLELLLLWLDLGLLNRYVINSSS